LEGVFAPMCAEVVLNSLRQLGSLTLINRNNHIIM
jgi:hypothetical protein